jgi:hypothetical protein
MKQHQMTHKFRDAADSAAAAAGQSSPHNNNNNNNNAEPRSAESSPLHSPPLSPAVGGGVKRSQEVAALVDRPPEKRAILCG